MKKYILPEIEIVKFSAEDVMTTSNTNTNPVINQYALADHGDGEFNYITEKDAF